MKIKREITIMADEQTVINFFKEISKNPKKYSFDSHEGITIMHGEIERPGARFMTREKFIFPITLYFQTVKAISDKEFRFRLTKPFLTASIFGKFVGEALTPDQTKLTLEIFSYPVKFFSKLLSFLVFLTPIRILVSNQLRKELSFIKGQIEK